MTLADRVRGITLTAILAPVILSCLLFPALAPAQGESATLSDEADRLSYEVLELKARLRTAQGNRDAMLAELAGLDTAIASSEMEIAGLNEELEACQQAYDLSLRALYKRGTVSEMEVILGARELEELWEDNAYFDRIMQSDIDTLERLKSKLNEVDLKRRELRDQYAQRKRMAEALDTEGLEARISELQARLSEVDASLRSLGDGGTSRNAPSGPAQGWTVPAPGELLERVPVMPPLSDFERTGMVFSGYTTCYGEEFDGNPTASGVIFHMYDYTCAHRTFPFGTWLLVTFRGRQTIVQVNDRGPFVPGRVLDLSYGSAQSIGLDGVQWTDFEILVPRER
ncbi:MAG: RlpA-like double-psi beta-barrel domain-containing protein [Actinomycetota bacterium]